MGFLKIPKTMLGPNYFAKMSYFLKVFCNDIIF